MTWLSQSMRIFYFALVYFPDSMIPILIYMMGNIQLWHLLHIRQNDPHIVVIIFLVYKLCAISLVVCDIMIIIKSAFIDWIIDHKNYIETSFLPFSLANRMTCCYGTQERSGLIYSVSVPFSTSDFNEWLWPFVQFYWTNVFSYIFHLIIVCQCTKWPGIPLLFFVFMF